MAWALAFTLVVYPVLVAAFAISWIAMLRGSLAAGSTDGLAGALGSIGLFSFVSSAVAGATAVLGGCIWASRQGRFRLPRVVGAGLVALILLLSAPFWFLALFVPAWVLDEAFPWLIAPAILVVLGMLSLGAGRRVLVLRWPTSLSVVVGVVLVLGSIIAMMFGSFGGMPGAGTAVTTFAITAGLGSNDSSGTGSGTAGGILRRLVGALLLGIGASLLDVSALYLVGSTLEGST